MPTVRVDDGVNLHYEESGQGLPLVFVHEFAGDHRSWHLQMRFFSRRYRAIAFNARGYPPSDVPDDAKAYSQDRAAADIRSVRSERRVARRLINSATWLRKVVTSSASTSMRRLDFLRSWRALPSRCLRIIAVAGL